MNIQTSYNKPLSLQPSHVIKLWRHRPLIFFKDVLDLEMDIWQQEATELYMNFQRVGVVANKGPGKTLWEAAIIWHFFALNHQPKVAVIAVTKDHLKANLWAELAKLHSNSDFLKKSVEPGSERFKLIGHEQYSFIDARSFPKQADNSQMASALAGLHAPNIMFALDEAGTIPDAVIATADNALSGGESDTMKKKIIAVGNPEVPSGILYRAVMGKTIQKWGTLRVTGDPKDPKRSPRVDVAWAQEQIDTFGEDDPWVQINVFGNYPKTAVDTLLSEEEIERSMALEIDERQVRNSQLRMGVDVARGGVDRTVFARRRGLIAYPLELFPSSHTGPDLAGLIALRQQDYNIERIMVDNTGGYGSSVIDSLNLFPNLDVTPVVYNKTAQDRRYYNCRTEMYVRLRDWVRKGGKLPRDKQLAEELMMPKLIFHGGIFRLEEKEQIKIRLKRSPDRADALAQTFSDVEQPSFFSDYSGTRSDGTQKSYDEVVHEWMNRKDGSNRMYVSDQSHIDKNFRPSPNYKA